MINNIRKLNEGLSSFHFTLSYLSIIPLFGSLTGSLKVIAGVIELVVSVIFAFLLFLPSLFFKYPRYFFRESQAHIFSSLKRITIGTFLAIPILGTLLIPAIYALNGGVIGMGYFQGVVTVSMEEGLNNAESFLENSFSSENLFS